MTTVADTPLDPNGSVVRVHFKCHAEVPIGSFLRVTGSTLWAPGTHATDPSESMPTVGKTEQSAFPVSEDPAVRNLHSLYTSSVEMVTTPDEYPVWRTRKPVAIVIHNTRKTVQHHYYRYLIVSPGGSVADLEMDDVEGNGLLVSTSNEEAGSTPVMQWEDPFGMIQAQKKGEISAVSLASSVTVGQATGTDYRNLPYRTLDIDIKSLAPLLDDGEDVRLDRWNFADDASFQAYRIRDAINTENRRKLEPRMSELSNSVDSVASDLAMAPGGLSRSGSATPLAFSQNDRIFFVCYHLPVMVVKNEASGEWNASWSESILAKTEGSQILSHFQAYWVGTVTTHPPLEKQEDKDAVREILEKMDCIPVFLDESIREAHYYGFCKQVLWPAFHNIDLLDLSISGWLPGRKVGASDWDQGRLEDWWKAYLQVNQAFSEKLSPLLRPKDIMWIHDYHLSILPQMQSAFEMERFGFRATRKVFFLHIPFPTSQVFRELDFGERILEGMLHADVVGFHAFDHARHFLNAAKRILGLNYDTMVGGLIGVGFRNSTVLVSMSNVSIEPRMVDAVLMLPSVKAEAMSLKKKHEGRMIIGGLDIGQRLSGTALKLVAYERLLQDYPSWKKHVVMVERLLIPGSRKADEELTCREVRTLVKRIEEKFGPAVIDYQEFSGTTLPMDQRLALWKASDILMTTPIREGLNHWPMEYIFAHKEPEIPGVVITSEFSAVSSILNGALRVNPYDIPMSITTIDKALTMSMQEREGRRYRDIDFVSSSPSDKWVKNVLRDLRDATSRYHPASENNSQVSTPYATPVPRKEIIVTTAGFLAKEHGAAFAHLNVGAMKRGFDEAKRRVVFLDFNGTIVLKEPPGKYLKRDILGTSGNKPPPAVLEALSILTRDPRNLIYVVSGDSVENVMNALGPLTGLGLAISNGARFSPPMVEGQTHREWFSFDLGVDWDAVKRVALPVLSKYTARSNGSFVKLTLFSIGWSYYSCDPEWGSLQASHLVLELESELRAFDVRFVTLKGVVEIVPRRLNKGLIVKQILRDTDANHADEGGVDFVGCFGDDISDEKMFTSVFSFLAERGDETNTSPGPPVVRNDGTVVPQTSVHNATGDTPAKCFTVAVGKKPSHASFWVTDGQEVANALVLMATGQIPRGGVSVWGHESTAEMFEN